MSYSFEIHKIGSRTSILALNKAKKSFATVFQFKPINLDPPPPPPLSPPIDITTKEILRLFVDSRYTTSNVNTISPMENC